MGEESFSDWYTTTITLPPLPPPPCPSQHLPSLHLSRSSTTILNRQWELQSSQSLQTSWNPDPRAPSTPCLNPKPDTKQRHPKIRKSDWFSSMAQLKNVATVTHGKQLLSSVTHPHSPTLPDHHQHPTAFCTCLAPPPGEHTTASLTANRGRQIRDKALSSSPPPCPSPPLGHHMCTSPHGPAL